MDVGTATGLFLILCSTYACYAVDYLANTMLSGHNVYIWKTLNRFQCASLCEKSDYCLSANYHPKSGQCELNDQKIDEEHPGTQRSHCVYLAPTVKSDKAQVCEGHCKRNEMCTTLDSRRAECLHVHKDDVATEPPTYTPDEQQTTTEKSHNEQQTTTEKGQDEQQTTKQNGQDEQQTIEENGQGGIPSFPGSGHPGKGRPKDSGHPGNKGRG